MDHERGYERKAAVLALEMNAGGDHELNAKMLECNFSADGCAFYSL